LLLAWLPIPRGKRARLYPSRSSFAFRPDKDVAEAVFVYGRYIAGDSVVGKKKQKILGSSQSRGGPFFDFVDEWISIESFSVYC